MINNTSRSNDSECNMITAADRIGVAFAVYSWLPVLKIFALFYNKFTTRSLRRPQHRYKWFTIPLSSLLPLRRKDARCCFPLRLNSPPIQHISHSASSLSQFDLNSFSAILRAHWYNLEADIPIPTVQWSLRCICVIAHLFSSESRVICALWAQSPDT